MHLLLSFYVLPFSLVLMAFWLDWAASLGLLDVLAGRTARQVIESLREHPEHWHQLDRFTVDFSIAPLQYSHESPARIWMANGRSFVSIDGKIKQSFHPLGKLCVWHACRRWQKQQVPALDDILAGRQWT